jgi:hypothetical protein
MRREVAVPELTASTREAARRLGVSDTALRVGKQAAAYAITKISSAVKPVRLASKRATSTAAVAPGPSGSQ